MSTATPLHLTERIPGPSPVPGLGWLPFALRFAFSPLTTLEDLRARYGRLIRFEFTRYPVVMIFDPAYNHKILRDPAHFYSYDLELVPVPFPKDSAVVRLTTGMPLMNGPRHRDHRSALLPYFHRQFITRYHAACVEATERKLANWRVGETIDLRTEMEQLAMWLATTPVLGLDPEREGQQIGRQLERTMNIIFNPFTLLLPYNVPGLPFHSLLKQANEMERIVRTVIERKRQEGLSGDDILSVMIRMHDEDPERLSERELIGHTTTMFRGGYNPNGMALYWTLFLLMQHPEKAQTLLNELNEKLGGQIPKPEQLEDLTYLEGAINEAMRLFPAGTWTGRLAMQDFELEGHTLPKGIWILLSPYITHRLPDVFPDPYKFTPERWENIHPSAYEFMPFSAGPRYCIGTSLGMMQLKIALAMILQRVSLNLKPGMRVDGVGLNAIRPKQGLPVTVQAAGIVPERVPFRGNLHQMVDFS